MIEVERTGTGDPMTFRVQIQEGHDQTRHRVTMSRTTHRRWTQDRVPPEATVEAAFRFLLDREPKESILEEFDVTVITRYFSDFEDRIPEYLSDMR